MITGDENAFPAISFDEFGSINVEREGLTIRQQFAAMAPLEIPEWFNAKIPNPPTEPMLNNLSEEDRKEVSEWRRDPIYDLPEHLEGIQNLFEKYWTERNQYNKDCLKYRYFQWRTFYADALIAELNKAVA